MVERMEGGDRGGGSWTIDGPTAGAQMLNVGLEDEDGPKNAKTAMCVDYSKTWAAVRGAVISEAASVAILTARALKQGLV